MKNDQRVGDLQSCPKPKGRNIDVPFLYVRPRNNHKRRVYHPLQAADGIWYGMVHFNHRHIRIERMSRDVWIPVEEVIRRDPLDPNLYAPTDLN
jgi:hypothetical protein